MNSKKIYCVASATTPKNAGLPPAFPVPLDVFGRATPHFQDLWSRLVNPGEIIVLWPTGASNFSGLLDWEEACQMSAAISGVSSPIGHSIPSPIQVKDLFYAKTTNGPQPPGCSWIQTNIPELNKFRDLRAENGEELTVPVRPVSPPEFSVPEVSITFKEETDESLKGLTAKERRKVLRTRELDAILLKLNKGQRESFDTLSAWMENPVSEDNPWAAVLSGYAGTGKSFLTKALLLRAEILDLDISASAPTHKAAGVLQAASGYQSSTIQSLFGMKMIADPDNPEEQILGPADEKALDNFHRQSLVLVDEAFMLGTPLWKPVAKIGSQKRVKMLLVGDDHQLNPIGEEFSPVSTYPQAVRTSLTEVMRHGGVLLELATAARNAQSTMELPDEWPSGFDAAKNEGVFIYRNQEEFYERLYERYLQTARTGEWSSIRSIAWRRKAVKHLSDQVCSVLGFDPNDLQAGELMSLADPVIKVEGRNRTVLMHQDTDFIVSSVRRGMCALPSEAIELSMDGIECYFVDVNGLTLSVPVNDAHVTSFITFLASKARRAANKRQTLSEGEPWEMFWRWRSKFHKLRRGYAITAHRAQGSGYEEVWIDGADILRNPNKEEAYRCLYTAITRAVKRVHIRF